MTQFEDLGLREELLRTLEEHDLTAATALQAAVIPVLRRGGNLVARASAGSGRMLAYALGVLDPLRAPARPSDAGEENGEGDAPAAGTRVLLLLPTEEEVERTAESLFPYVQAVGLAMTTADGTWATPVTRAEVLVGTPGAVMDAVRGSALKLEALEAVVIDGARAIQELGAWELVDTLLDFVPRDAQRVLFSSAMTEQIEDLIDRRIKRALRYPSEPAVAVESPAEVQGEAGYVVATAREKIELLARVLARPRQGSAPVLFCRTDERAAQLAELLTMRGFLVGELNDADTDVVLLTAGTSRAELVQESGEEPERTISYDVPPDAQTLRARHGGDPNAIIFTEPRELAHLHEIAAQARLGLTVFLSPADATTAQAHRIDVFRQELERAIGEEDLAAQLLVLQPLLERYPAVELAAAATALLRSRRRAPAAPAAATPGTPRAAAPPVAQAARPERDRGDAGPPPATWTRLYIGIGSRDGVRPGDLVGAIAGEANIPGSRVGKIEIRDTFSIVEVQADVAQQVITAVNGTTLKGRSVRADYDRGADRARRASPAGRGSGERRGPPTRGPREPGARPRLPGRRREEE